MEQATEMYYNPAQILNLYHHFIQKFVLPSIVDWTNSRQLRKETGKKNEKIFFKYNFRIVFKTGKYT